MGDRLVAHSTCEQPYHFNLARREIEMFPALTVFALRGGRAGERLDPRQRGDDALARENTFEHFDERLAGEILRDYAGGAAPYGLGHLLARHVPRENNDGDVGMALPSDIDAARTVHSRHDEIQQQAIRLRRRGAVESLAQTARLDYVGRQ